MKEEKQPVGRPEKPEDERTRPYSLSLTNGERNNWKKKAAKAKQTLSQYAKSKMEL